MGGVSWWTGAVSKYWFSRGGDRCRLLLGRSDFRKNCRISKDCLCQFCKSVYYFYTQLIISDLGASILTSLLIKTVLRFFHCVKIFPWHGVKIFPLCKNFSTV